MSIKAIFAAIFMMVQLGCLNVFATDALAQDENLDYGFLNPGVKIGYTFGGGLTIGFEVSGGVYNGFLGGVAAGIDYTLWSGEADIFRFYLEGELGFILAGAGVGGALLVRDGEANLSGQTTIFAAWPTDWADPDRYEVIVPYYRVTWGKKMTFKEFGFMYKYSYPIGKGNYDNRWEFGS